MSAANKITLAKPVAGLLNQTYELIMYQSSQASRETVHLGVTDVGARTFADSLRIMMRDESWVQHELDGNA